MKAQPLETQNKFKYLITINNEKLLTHGMNSTVKVPMEKMPPLTSLRVWLCISLCGGTSLHSTDITSGACNLGTWNKVHKNIQLPLKRGNLFPLNLSVTKTNTAKFHSSEWFIWVYLVIWRHHSKDYFSGEYLWGPGLLHLSMFHLTD